VVSAPPLDQLSDREALELLLVFIAFAIFLIGLVWVFVRAMLRAATLPAPTMLVIALSMITVIALIAASVTGSAALETITASGVGALAGAVSQQFITRDEDDDEDS
jgi:uncharacterized membrane protein YoaK (UPF0700 family)